MDMNAAILADNQLMNNFKRMAEITLRDEMIEKVIRRIFNVNGNTKQDQISTRKTNIISSFADALDTEIKLEGKTVWGLFNAVTRYTNHIAAPQNQSAKQDYLMVGTGYRLSNMTYEMLMEEIGETTYA
jgi:hypothetical protein